MSRQKTKFPLLVLSVGLFAAALSACGSNNGTDSEASSQPAGGGSAPPASSPASSSASSPAAGSSGSGPWADYPGLQTAADYAKAHPYDKKMTITMFNSGSFHPGAAVPPLDQDPERQMLDKAVNVDLQMTVVQPADATNKLNTLAAAGNLPDLIFFASKQDAVNYYNQGLIADIGPALKDYPDLVNRFTPDEWSDLQYKGATLGSPGYDLVSGIQGWWIRQDWLDQLNLKAPTTSDELLNVMQAFANHDPDGDGKKDTYGFVAGVNKDGTFGALGWAQVLWMFGVTPENLDVQNGQLVDESTDPRMKQALSYVNQMIQMNLVDPDWVSINDGGALDQKMFNGMDGIVINDWRRLEPSYQEAMKKVTGTVPKWTMIAPPKGPNGDPILAQAAVQSNMWAISKKAASDPDKLKRILSLLDYWYADKDAYPYFAYGIKGVFWDDKDGQPAKITYSKDDDSKYEFVYHYALPRGANDPAYFNFGNPDTAGYHDLNMKYVVPNAYSAFVTQDPSDTLYVDRNKYVYEELLRFMTGKESMDNWDSFVDTLNSKFKLQTYLDLSAKQLQDQGVLK